LQFPAWAIYYQVTRGARIEEFRVEILYKKLWKLLIDRQTPQGPGNLPPAADKHLEWNKNN
jgi:hypothetical protein